MLSTYGKSLRPDAELTSIIELTNGYPEKEYKKWRKFSSTNTNNIFIILKGNVEFRRSSDELCMFTLDAPFIFGLANLFYNVSNVHGVARSDLVVREVDKNDFIRLVTEHNCWEALTKVLSWFLCVFKKRDDVLVARSAYQVIRDFLLEINELVVNYNRDINVYDYIQEYTDLARSTIIKILSDLKKGQYIVVKKGRLLSMTTLPERY
ncbi:helix-turn-helix domain-containing protein [Scandinavium sp. H11S7]|uniref:helix-turn-helix domain-containing protein n=1 Tax=Scandinavium hiltneri TaxID=2926519 RepID=UPI00216588DF|nr:helix-turn-helix domain-containing protein [Scandinavium hiltneri]MCS2158424.1 helix-turn-helix domain-containing protein [Scandinavium hiltneri]